MVDLHNLCMGCMGDNGGLDVCPHCGFEEAMRPQPEQCLPLRTLLQNRYIVGKLLESNGEGFSYIGYDTVSSSPVSIREFMPENLCKRESEDGSLTVLENSEKEFKEYKIEFLEYFRDIARLRELPVMVPIYDIFQQNHTAYVISEWEEHITLREFVERSGGRLEWNAARPLFMPVLSGLSDLYQSGVKHLGISPDSLLIQQSGKMKLGGFSINSVRRQNLTLQPELFEGCAAIEQYLEPAKISQATDVYGFTATLFYALTGAVPQDAMKRRGDGRLLIPTNILKAIPPHVVTALANGLQIEPDKRTLTFERLRAELSAAPTVTMVLNEVAAPPQMPPPQRKREEIAQKRKGGIPNFVWGVIACVLALALFLGIALLWMNKEDDKEAASSTVSQNSAISSSSEVSEAESDAAEEIDLPNLANVNFNEAQQNAENEGTYQVLLSSENFDDSVEVGFIISQTPAYEEGAKIKEGSIVAVVVSKGPKMRPLPDVVGLSLVDASTQLTALGFVPEKMEERFSDAYSEGKVIGYVNYSAQQELPYGSTVGLVLSKGKDPTVSAGTNHQ